MLRYIVLCLFLGSPVVTLAQDTTGNISGSVIDPQSAAVGGATVKLVSDGTGASWTQTTKDDGSFLFVALKSGFYSISVEHTGFKKYERSHMELVGGEKLSTGPLALAMGAVSEAVQVSSQGEAVQTATSERSGLLTSKEVEQLTVINRDFTSLAQLMPGVVFTPGAQVQTFTGFNSLYANGGRSTANNIMIDGVPAKATNQAGNSTTISMDNTATVEVKLSNYLAESGRTNGATIIAISKSGTDHYHGAAYYYDRNEALNANNFFSNRAGLARPRSRVSYAGANFGGPLRIPRVNATKGKLFFFFSAEKIQEMRYQGLVNVTVPTALERSGDFSMTSAATGKPVSPILGTATAIAVKDSTTGTPFPGGVIPANRIVPSMKNYLNLLPLPNFVSDQNLRVSNGNYNYVFQESLNVPKWLNSARADYNISEKTQLFARFNYWWEDQQGNNVSAANTSWGWMPEHYIAITPSGVISLSHIFTPTLVFQGRVGFQQFSENGPPLSMDQITAKQRSTVGFTLPQLYPASNPYNLVPAATFGGVSNPANPNYNSRFPLEGVEDTWTYNGSVTKMMGAHALKAGISAEHWLAMKGKNAASFAGTMYFLPAAANPLDTGYAYSNALLGVVNTYQETNGRFPMYEVDTTAEWYLQDTWKIGRRLTLDLGLRWGWGTPWHPPDSREAAFVPSAWNPQQAAKLIQPTIVNGQRMGLDPYTGATLPAPTIGAIAPEANQINGIVNRVTNPSYPAGMRYGSGIKTGPHFGLAWDPFGNGKTAIRLGGAIYYNIHESDNYTFGYQYSTPPLQYNPTMYYTYMTQMQQVQGYNFPSSISGFNPVHPVQQTYSYSVGFQQDVGFGTVFEAAYVGSLGRHLVQGVNLNAIPTGTDYLASSQDATTGGLYAAQFLRRYAGWQDISYYYQGGNSNYHSLQTQLHRRYKNNLTYGLVWTWSKATDYIDTETAGSLVNSLIDPKLWNYGLAGFDRTHILKVFWTYNLPKASSVLRNKLVKYAFDNWQISGIYTAQSGAPASVSFSYSPGQDILGTPSYSPRINVVGDANANIPAGGSLPYGFNPVAFAPVPYQACEVANPAFSCWGNAGRTTYRAPGVNNFDLSLFKNVLIGERFRAQLRVEGYNAFNHTQYNSVNSSAIFNLQGVQTNTALGQYNGAASPRNIQIAVRLMF
jgi:hypothetical protein